MAHLAPATKYRITRQLARIVLPNDDLIEKIDKELGRAKGGPAKS